LIFIVALTILIALLAFIFSNQISTIFFRSPNFSYIIILNFLTIPLYMITVMPLTRLKLEENAKAFTFFSVSRVVTGVILNIILIVVLKRGLNGLFEGPFLNSILYAVILGLYSLKTSGLKFSKTIFLKLFVFGFPFLLATIAFWIMDWADRFILVRLTNLSEVGLYNLGYSIGMAITLLLVAFEAAWPPFYLAIARKRNAKKIYSAVFTYYSLIVGFFVLLISIFGRDYFEFFTKEEFHGAYLVIPLVTLAYALKGNFIIAAVGAFLKKKSFYQFYTEGIAVLLNIGGMFLLIPLMGRLGAAWATLVAYLILTPVIIWLSRKIYPMKYELNRIIQIVVIGVGLYVLAKTIYQPTFSNVIIRFILVLFYPIALWLIGFFNNDEIKRLKSIYAKYKLRVAPSLFNK